MAYDKEFASLGELSSFIQKYDLRDKHSNVSFNAIVHFSIKGKDSYEDTEVRITMDGYNPGMVYLNTVDPQKYPDKFQAKWNDFKYVPGTGLTIENDGNHPRFGRFHITISPK